MSNSKLTKVATAVRGSFDRRTVGGVVIGAAVMLSAMAFADSTNPAWFASLGSPSASNVTPNASLITLQESAIAKDILGNPCDQPGGIQKAASDAILAHTKLASAGPQVETLFDVNDDCFSSINKIYDLSFTIPSLDMILKAAQDAVLKYAEKKVCTAVNKVTGMVTSPINQAIDEINGMAGFANINGMASGAVAGGMAKIDPQLGASFNPPVQAGTYTTNVNPFNATQTTFTPGAGDPSGSINGSVANINALMTQIGNLLIAINDDNAALQSVTNQLNACENNNQNNNNYMDCSGLQSAVTAATQKLAQDQAMLAQAQQLLATSGGGNQMAGAGMAMHSGPAQQGQIAAAPAGSVQSAQAAPGNFWSKVTGLFN